MNPLRWLRRRFDTHDIKVFTTSVQDDDPTRPTQCECGEPATLWVNYLHRQIDHKRTEFVIGNTTEDVCTKHFHGLLTDPDVVVNEWGAL